MRSFRGSGDHPACQLNCVSTQTVGKRTLTEALGDAEAATQGAAPVVSSAAEAAPTGGRDMLPARRPTLESLFAPVARRPSVQEEPTGRQALDPSKTGEQEDSGAETSEGAPVRYEPHMANLQPGDRNQWNELDGHLTSDVTPHVFVNGGKTGSAMDNTVGGRGGSGDQAVADITVVAPQYESRAPAGAGAQARAWIRPGTGTATVTRSYTGSLTGANGPTLYMTARAVARTDAHEVLHIQSSRAIHDRHIVPLEARVAARTSEPNALSSGTSAAEAQTALQNVINWNATITAFQNEDRAANTPMGTVDTTDLASPTFIRDYGPRRVNGVNYTHYFDTPPGPPAGPTAPP
jgi:hypothetical protein